MLLHLTDFSAEPLHRQIFAQLAAKVCAGDLLPGTELLPGRVLARQHHVNANAVERAYWELAREGVVASQDGKAFVVLALNPEQKRELRRRHLPGHATFAPASATESTTPRFDEDLHRAQQLQNGLLPKTLPNNARIQVAAHTAPARGIGGDFYDCIPLAAHRFALVIADACGQGLAAALLISQIQALLKNAVEQGHAVRQIMRSLNHHVHHYSAKNFATLFYGVFDEHTGILKFANAGHHPPLLVRASGKIELLATTGPALGVLTATEHATQSVATASGDCILFYTDGVTETMNEGREEFGEHRLLAAFFRQREHSAQQIVQQLMAELREFEAPNSFPDDKTLMALKIL
jgi:sigma-B regulation protein RsbU (phosphoserine phosphatase)